MRAFAWRARAKQKERQSLFLSLFPGASGFLRRRALRPPRDAGTRRGRGERLGTTRYQPKNPRAPAAADREKAGDSPGTTTAKKNGERYARPPLSPSPPRSPLARVPVGANPTHFPHPRLIHPPKTPQFVSFEHLSQRRGRRTPMTSGGARSAHMTRLRRPPPPKKIPP